MSDIIKDAKRLAELKVPPLRAEITVHEDEDPRYTDDCLVQIIEKDDGYSIWYEEEHGGYEHGKLHFAHVFAAAPELAQALAEETYEYAVQAKIGSRWEYKQDGFFRDAWFSKLRKAKAGARELRSIGKETRIVRRRVSPPEVISE